MDLTKATMSSSPLVGMVKPTSAADGQEEERRILFAIPKKGRLASQVMDMVEGAGLHHTRPHRLDVALCKSEAVTLVFLPASDIASYVGDGDVDMGITGEDIIEETGLEVEVLEQLGIGKCKLCLQTPVGTCKDPSGLVGKRIVTSFPNLTKNYFAKLEGTTADEITTDVRYVSGSVEVACCLGLADGVVDLVETGTTMRAAGLEPAGVVMTSQTVLIMNPKCQNTALVEKIRKRIKGFLTAKSKSMLSYNVEKANLDAALALTPGSTSPTVVPLHNSDFMSVTVLVNSKEVSALMDALEEIGATGLVVYQAENCRI